MSMLRNTLVSNDSQSFSSHHEFWRGSAKRHRRISSALHLRHPHTVHSDITADPLSDHQVVDNNNHRTIKKSQLFLLTRPATSTGYGPRRQLHSAPLTVTQGTEQTARSTASSRTRRCASACARSTYTGDSSHTLYPDSTCNANERPEDSTQPGSPPHRQDKRRASREEGPDQPVSEALLAARAQATLLARLNTYSKGRQAWSHFEENVKSIRDNPSAPAAPTLPHLKYSPSFVDVVDEYVKEAATDKTKDKPSPQQKKPNLKFFSSTLKVMSTERRRHEALRRWGLIRDKVQEISSHRQKAKFDSWAMLRKAIAQISELENARRDLYMRYGILPNEEGKVVCLMRQPPNLPLTKAALEKIRLRHRPRRIRTERIN